MKSVTPGSVRRLTPVIVAFIVAALPAWAQQSASYRIERATLVASATSSVSSSYQTTLTLGQSVPTGAASACNTGYRQSLGFWSVLGDLQVPIVLHLDKTAQNPLTVELSWSGVDEEFELYRGFAPQGLIAPEHLDLMTSQCSALDHGASDADALYYLVVPASRQ